MRDAHRKGRRICGRVGGIALALLVLPACGLVGGDGGGGGGGGVEDPPEIGPIPTITDSTQISLPLDAYHMTAEQDLTIQRAEWQLAVDCMARLGVQYEPPSQLVPAMSSTNHSRRYGLVDLESARQWGYHGGDPAALQEQEEAELAQLEAQEQSAEVEAMLDGNYAEGQRPSGVPEGGCIGEARRELAAGGETVSESVLFDLAAATAIHAEQDGRVQAAFDRWSDCMAEAGFDYDGPWDANNQGWETPSGRITEREKTVATADVTCKHTTNLVGIWNAVDVAYQERSIEENAELLTDLKAARERRLENAASVVSG